ncbi:MAG: hypothetical protein IJV09_01385 [Prevotella sp.]|nr:hypothetical protein [Prevotella sp.]
MKPRHPVYGGGTFDPRSPGLRTEEAAPSSAGGAAFVRHRKKLLFYDSFCHFDVTNVTLMSPSSIPFSTVVCLTFGDM